VQFRLAPAMGSGRRVGEPEGMGEVEPFPAAARAPEFPPGLTWFNGGPRTVAGLRGRPVLLDFWTHG